jgi:hypothetical protein
MDKLLSKRAQQLREYLLQPSERNEDLAISYFRALFPETFRRQSDAANADGYVPGHFLLELKGQTNDWYSALYQAIAYENKGLSFPLVVVCARNFLAIWRKDDIPENIRSEISAESRAPSAVGKLYARRFASKRKSILQSAVWYHPGISGDLYIRTDDTFLEAIESFENTLSKQRPVRVDITLNNFVLKLRELKQFFNPSAPIKTVRAFYSMLYGPWDESSVLTLSLRHDDRATLGGAEITDLVPAKRRAFKQFVEKHSIRLLDGQSKDDFFSRFDKALDAIDRDFRVKHGIFFTDLYLSRFAMWFVRQALPNLGRSHLVVDPACGSGNLVTNWRSPLELRHKVVSEIEPELLYAVEQRMKGDEWHNGRFTVVPKVSEGVGLNFLDKSAAEYLSILRTYLTERGHRPDRPLAFLCNPPYRSDDDQSAEPIDYKVHETITSLLGPDAASERYCCFLAQMALICEAAEDSGLPDQSILMLFTKVSWLTRRPVFRKLRSRLLESFENVSGMMINGKEFFDVKGKFPIAFTVWRYVGTSVKLDADRSVPLIDLTRLKKKDLVSLPWDDSDALSTRCRAILADSTSASVHIGAPRRSIKDWSGARMADFKRSRRAREASSDRAGGLPRGDRRLRNLKAYGESAGTAVGFMDDLTPCRVKERATGVPWFRLDLPFMDVRKTRCFSGPPDQKGYTPTDAHTAFCMFSWYAICKTFAQVGYPMWADALEIWAPNTPNKLVHEVRRLVSPCANVT